MHLYPHVLAFLDITMLTAFVDLLIQNIEEIRLVLTQGNHKKYSDY